MYIIQLTIATREKSLCKNFQVIYLTLEVGRPMDRETLEECPGGWSMEIQNPQNLGSDGDRYAQRLSSDWYLSFAFGVSHSIL